MLPWRKYQRYEGLQKTTNKKIPNAEIAIIHTGTNDLSDDSSPTDIATNIIDLAADVKKTLNRSCDVMISSIIPRGDQL